MKKRNYTRKRRSKNQDDNLDIASFKKQINKSSKELKRQLRVEFRNALKSIDVWATDFYRSIASI